jgi:hypothetical protein
VPPAHADPSDDPFASTGPWVSPPETWGELSASDDGRDRALALGPMHGHVVESLLNLGAQNGGGLRGIVVGMFDRLEALQIMNGGDRTHLEALMELLRANEGSSGADQQAAFTQLQVMHEALVADPAASPFALGCSSVVLDSVTRALSRHDPNPAIVTAYADLAGYILGGTGGPLGSYAVGAGLSVLASTTMVSVTVSYS